MSPLRDIVESCPDLDRPRTELKRFREHDSSSAAASLSHLKALKAQAITSANQLLAAGVWCLERITQAQDAYLSAFEAARALEFYSCWQKLERVEISLIHLERHYVDKFDAFGVRTMRDSVERLQSLFPYRMFFSPGLEILEQLCSICRAPIRLRSSCGHKRLELYDGEMCGRIITKARANHFAIVENPVQKYSVAFPRDGKPFNYALVDYVVRGLCTPWSRWRYEIEKRVRPSLSLGLDREMFRGLGRNAPCACGSRLKFKKCCLERMTEVYDHYQIQFQEPPSPGLPCLIPDAFVEGVDDMRPPPSLNEAEFELPTEGSERSRHVEAVLLSKEVAPSGTIIDI